MKRIYNLIAIVVLSSLISACKDDSAKLDLDLLSCSWTTKRIIENGIDVTSTKGTATLNIPAFTTLPTGVCHIFIPGSPVVFDKDVLWEVDNGNIFTYFDGSGGTHLTITKLTAHELELTDDSIGFIWNLQCL